MAESDRGSGWLPPEASGPEHRPAAPGEPPPPSASGPPPATSGAPPPHGPPPGGAAPSGPPSAPAYGQHPPPPGYPPPAYAPGAYGPPTQPSADEPGNGEAVAALVLGVCSLAFLLISAGLSTIISLICAVLAIIFGRRGKRNVESGRTRKHRGLAQAGYVTGIVGAALSVLATAFWVVIAIVAESDSDFDQEFQRGFDQSSRALPFAQLAVAVGRGLFG